MPGGRPIAVRVAADRGQVGVPLAGREKPSHRIRLARLQPAERVGATGLPRGDQLGLRHRHQEVRHEGPRVDPAPAAPGLRAVTITRNSCQSSLLFNYKEWSAVSSLLN